MSRLEELLAGLPLVPSGGASQGGVEARGLTHDSRRVEAGDLFVTWSGERHRGREFAIEAIRRGAVAVVCDEAPESVPEVPWFVSQSPRRLLAPIAARLYRHPDRELMLVGVTGTNGKTTTATLVASALGAAGWEAGLLGTLGYRFGRLEFAGGHTTPEASDLFRILRSMRDAGAKGAAMEVSSHALVQGRVDEVQFQVAAFTNLTRDHLDFHTDLQSYFLAKRRLFDQLRPGGRAVVNLDDEYGRRLAQELGDCVSYACETADAAVTVRDVVTDVRGTSATVRTPRGEFAIDSPLLGRINLSNLLAAVGIAEALRLPHAATAVALASQRPLAGRMEPIEAGQEFPILVDYAHTEAALASALRSMRDLSSRRVVVVFGCGGDRDRGKRAPMGRVAGQLADLAIATSDNPRSEDPLAILTAIEEGLRASGSREYRLVPERAAAIAEALALAHREPGRWAVLVAGKGHESEQIVGDRVLPFSDRGELERGVAQLGAGR
jgi:UDP-N-acetylmuramoyl-L-alanyl-D-glutamate--2,6-diaminopimelate ligase